MSETDFEYFEGTKTIQHADGSTTYINTYHEPYVEPLTGRSRLPFSASAPLSSRASSRCPTAWCDWRSGPTTVLRSAA
jgi:hypothetical protein